MAAKKAIEKLHDVVGGNLGYLSDGSGSFVAIENRDFEICFSFDGKGKTYEGCSIAKKIWQVVDQEMISKINPSNQK